MSNDYFNNTNYTLTAGEIAKAATVENKFDDVAAGFEMLPSEERLLRDTINWIDDAGTANTYVVTLTYAPDALVDGMFVSMRVKTTNTGASTLNVNALGAKSIKDIDGSAIAASTLVAGRIAEFRYDEDNDYFVHIHATGTISVNTGSIDFSDGVITSGATAVAGKGYPCDTKTTGAFTLTLPLSPSVGDSVGVKDAADYFVINNLTIGRNSEKIMGLAEDLTVNISNVSLELVYTGATYGWIL